MSAESSFGRIIDQLLPVTALCTVGNWVVAGEGAALKIFNKRNGKLVRVLRIFRNHQTVHGIRAKCLNEEQVLLLIWGGKFLQCRSISLRDLENSEEVTTEEPLTDTLATDLILDAAWNISSESTSKHDAIIVTAHNSIARVTADLEASNTSKLSITPLTGITRSLLYTAEVKWMSPSHVVVASGTPSGVIILWSVFFGSSDHLSCDCVTNYVFNAHDGSIFGTSLAIDYERAKLGSETTEQIEGNQETAEDVAPSLVLATCSDDRTIRLWDVSLALQDLRSHPQRYQSTTKTSLGLGLPAPMWGIQGYSNPDAPNLLLKTWAHSSRIWKVALTKTVAPEMKTTWLLLSFGEDAVCEVRTIVGAASSFSVADTQKYQCHHGKHIWSHAETSDTSLADSSIYTGGADGAIVALSPFRRDIERHQWTYKSLGILQEPEDSLSSASKTLKRSKADGFQAYDFLSPNMLFATSRHGHILLMDGLEESLESGSWRRIGQLEDLRDFSLVAGLPEVGLGFMAGSTGKVYLVTASNFQDDADTRLHTLVNLDEKPANLFAALNGRDFIVAEKDSSSEGKAIAVVLQSFTKPVASLFTWSTADVTSSSPSKTILHLPPSFNITSMCYVQDSIFLGSRSGSIVEYTLHRNDGKPSANTETTTHESSPQESLNHSIHPLHEWSAHGEAVTSLLPIPPSTPGSPPDVIHLCSTGRDAHLTITLLTPHAQPQIIHSLSMPAGQFLEGNALRATDKHLIIWGFKNSNIVVYDATTQEVLLEIESGGSHRRWAFLPSLLGGGTFLWTRASVVHAHRQPTSLSHRIRSGGHGREIKCVAIRNQRVNERHLLATGAEDTDIRIFEGPHKGEVRCLATLRKHVTGVLALQWSADGRFLFSSGGREELFVWRVTPDVPGVAVGVVRVASMPLASEVQDLRVTGFCAVESNAGYDFWVTVVFSDSTVRVYGLKVQAASWELLATHAYSTACLTNVIVPREVITTATDGKVALWGSFERFVAEGMFESVRVHQNSIKAVLLLDIPGEGTKGKMLVTAGDDNAIALSLLAEGDSPSRGERMRVIDKRPRAHAAAITALARLPIDPADTDALALRSFVSVGNDQRVKVWTVRFARRGEGWDVGFCRVRDSGVSVADASSAQLVPQENAGEQHVWVAGVGMQRLCFTPDRPSDPQTLVD